MIVILNPKAGGGTALKRWRRIESRVAERIGAYTLVVAQNRTMVEESVAEALARGERRFVAAGGDGMVNLVMCAILTKAPPGALLEVRLGAVGLGSSNDFHKPHVPGRLIKGVPVKLDFDAAIPHDIGVLTYRDEANELCSRRWLINASVGTTAEANRFFNNPNRLLVKLKRVLPSLGMIYAALRTVLAYRSGKMVLTVDEGETVYTRVKNLGIVKNPHFTGALRYDTPHEPGSGYFYVHLLKNVPLPSLAFTLLGLLRGKFNGCRGARSWRATRLRIEADRPFAIEGDGEVVTATRAYVTLVPDLLQVCTQ